MFLMWGVIFIIKSWSGDMKKILILFSTAAVVIALFGKITVAAETPSDVEKYTTERTTEYLSKIGFRPLSQEPKKQCINTFDISENGWVAIGFVNNDANMGVVVVYDENGSFQYGYAFICYGTFEINWDQDNIQIYFVRSSIVGTFDKNERVLDMYEIISNDYTDINKIFSANTKTVGNVQYKMRNKFFFLNILPFEYSQIISKDAAGNSTIIYQADQQAIDRMVNKFITLALFINVVMACVILMCIDISKNKQIFGPFWGG